MAIAAVAMGEVTVVVGRDGGGGSTGGYRLLPPEAILHLCRGIGLGNLLVVPLLHTVCPVELTTGFW